MSTGTSVLHGLPPRVQQMLARGWLQIESVSETWVFTHPDRDGLVTLPAEGPCDD